MLSSLQGSELFYIISTSQFCPSHPGFGMIVSLISIYLSFVPLNVQVNCCWYIQSWAISVTRHFKYFITSKKKRHSLAVTACVAVTISLTNTKEIGDSGLQTVSSPFQWLCFGAQKMGHLSAGLFTVSPDPIISLEKGSTELTCCLPRVESVFAF